MKQEIFLTNTHTKPVKQADFDVDVLIIETAVEQFYRTNTTIIVGDVHLLILLNEQTPTDKIIYFLNPGKPQTMQTKIYSPQI